MNKKALFSHLGNFILIIAILVILLIIILSIRKSAKESMDNSQCVASINTHMAFVASVTEANQKKDELLGWKTLLLPDTKMDDIPPIECTTKLIKSNARTAEDGEKELLKRLVETWDLFHNGKAMLYPSEGENTFCIVKDVIKFKKGMDFNITRASVSTTIDSISKIHNEEGNVRDYIFDTVEDGSRESSSTFSSPGNLFYFSSYYYDGDRDNPFLSSFFVATNMNMIIHEFNKEEFDKKFNPTDFNEYGSHNKEPEYYAIIFMQYHYIPNRGYWVKVKRQIHDSLFNDNYDLLPKNLIFSSILIIPYTKEIMSQVKCDYLPSQFEKSI